MRIYGNRLLKTLPGQSTRPTSGRVREALFNIWHNKISDCCWLDLCAGNGSMGAEALYRGAKEVIGIEQNGKACPIIQENWQKAIEPGQSFQIIKGDVSMKIKQLAGKKFDCIYFDPPYLSNLYLPVLQEIANLNLLASLGEVAVEHNPKFWQARSIPNLEICREKVYGNTSLTFYQFHSS
jgi:16S rRNA (guanine966-N2)-methyltransferase